MIRQFIESLGSSIIEHIQEFGRFCNYILHFFYWLCKPPLRIKLFFQDFYFIGNKSLFIILLAGSFTGMVMAYQSYFGFKLISVDSLVGTIVASTLAKELGPVLTGLILAGRAGSAMAAQIGAMKVTEQIDALEIMGISSMQYLAIPKIVATTLALPMLTVIFTFIGNIGSWFVGTKIFLIDPTLYFSKIGSMMHVADILQGLIKATIFGFVISLIGTYFGFQVKKGAVGVGKGTNKAVVWGMISVLMIDYFVTSFLIQIL